MQKKKNIADFLESTQLFAENEILDFVAKGKNITFKKGELLVREGQTCKKVYFIHTGIVSLYLLKDGEEHIKDFSIDGKFITSYTSMVQEKPSAIYLRAERDCILTEWTAEYYKQLTKDKHSWCLFAKQIADYLFYRKEQRELNLLLDPAKVRYNKFLKDFPNLEQLVPQYLIASYLGIKPQSLSRLRKQP